MLRGAPAPPGRRSRRLPRRQRGGARRPHPRRLHARVPGRLPVPRNGRRSSAPGRGGGQLRPRQRPLGAPVERARRLAGLGEGGPPPGALRWAAGSLGKRPQGH
eukprot:11156791-Lingulodinium_polyedra.AAC.1